MKSPAFWWHATLHPFAYILYPFSKTYAAAAFLHGKLRGLRPYYTGVPVISVGNLTAGGAGKTPVTIWLAEHFSSQGHQVAIVSRGYGGKETQYPQQVNPYQHAAWQVGDEPLLMSQHFVNKSVSVWVGRHRPTVVRRAEQAGATLILLDDGFQRQDIARNINILVINGANPWGNGQTIPAGPLREGLSARSRASFAIVLDEPEAKTNTYYGLDAYRLFTKPTAESLARIKGPTIAFAGIAHPEKFFQTLQQSGVNMLEKYSYSDHHPYRTADLDFLTARTKKLNAQLVTTTKDAVRLPQNFAIPLATNLQGADEQSILSEIHLRLS